MPRLVNKACPLCGSEDFKLLKKASYSFGKCRQCGLYFLNPFPEFDKQELEAFYHNYDFNQGYIQDFADYEEDFKISLKKKLRVASAFNKYLVAGNRIRLLDIGCGSGLYVKAANYLGLMGLGVDVDKDACQFGRSLGLKIFQGELSEAAFPDEHFDVILIKQVLEHISSPVDFMREVNRILKYRGLCIIDVPNQAGLIPKLKVLVNRPREEYGFLQPLKHLYAFNRKSLAYLLVKTGFSVKKVITSYPGDKTYYPIHGQGLWQKMVFRLSGAIGLGSVLVMYAMKD